MSRVKAAASRWLISDKRFPSVKLGNSARVGMAAGGAKRQLPFRGFSAAFVLVSFENAAKVFVLEETQIDRLRRLDGAAHHVLCVVKRPFASPAGRKTPP